VVITRVVKRAKRVEAMLKTGVDDIWRLDLESISLRGTFSFLNAFASANLFCDNSFHPIVVHVLLCSGYISVQKGAYT
jgi:hypothetical protein